MRTLETREEITVPQESSKLKDQNISKKTSQKGCFISTIVVPPPTRHSSQSRGEAQRVAATMGRRGKAEQPFNMLAFQEPPWGVGFCLSGLQTVKGDHVLWVPEGGWECRKAPWLIAAPGNLQYCKQVSEGARDYTLPLEQLEITSTCICPEEMSSLKRFEGPQEPLAKLTGEGLPLHGASQKRRRE